VLSEDDLQDLRIALIRAHDRTIESDGGRIGLPRPDLLDLAIHRPFIIAGRYDNPFKIAAAIAESIAHNHPFADGNKRTASIAMSLILLDSNFRLQNQLAQRIEVLRRAAEGEIGATELIEYITQHAIPIATGS
jgi:death on curing protein